MVGGSKPFHVYGSARRRPRWRPAFPSWSRTADHQRLNLGDLTIFDLQSKRNCRGYAFSSACFLADISDERNLPGLRIGNDDPIFSFADGRLPFSLADIQPP